MSRTVVIKITATVEDSVTDEQLDYVAAAATFQVIEPVLSAEDEGRATFGVINYVTTIWESLT